MIHMQFSTPEHKHEAPIMLRLGRQFLIHEWEVSEHYALVRSVPWLDVTSLPHWLSMMKTCGWKLVETSAFSGNATCESAAYLFEWIGKSE